SAYAAAAGEPLEGRQARFLPRAGSRPCGDLEAPRHRDAGVRVLDMQPTIKYRLGFLGALTLFLIGLGLLALGAVGEVTNWRDDAKLSRLETIDRLIGKRFTGAVVSLRGAAAEKSEHIEELRSHIGEATVDLDLPSATAQTILVSTA